MLQEKMTIVSQKSLAPRIFEMKLQGDLVQEMNKAGQFIHIKVPSEDKVLRRPISLAKIDKKTNSCTIIYRVEGGGTAIFSKMKAGDTLDVLGPLGNGFDTSVVESGQTALVIGGGIGTPPMYELSRQLKEKGVQVIHLIGFASRDVMFYQDKFLSLGETHFSTDDGSFGLHGHVGLLIDDLLAKGIKPDAVYACGANGLLKAVDEKFAQHPNAYISMEARMACGMGACYACVVHVVGDETGASSLKVCDQGPVFETGRVVV
ncbi:dihydroorotate dehydrogenase electron transfer subunit [Pilibacter termitis]|uniref:Dihydroorotate dehydrogenase B (NAD(+)), electron transfer subunit n=1 Tax=Pilibacter termitis TaxID=263852 RepID=A0A1T4L8W1_9ENTE|nr:dihydroorotate dehydrogenase electron transfer subunit [Pilibacter termitis]SJZ51169.1 dihydroorotate dehydrogenase electron transfer subunit [Pilibacter termitis]